MDVKIGQLIQECISWKAWWQSWQSNTRTSIHSYWRTYYSTPTGLKKLAHNVTRLQKGV